MKWLLTPIVVLLLIGCSSTPTIIEKPYPVYVAGVHDTIPLAQDTIYLPSDSNAYWEGNVEDSLNNVIGWLKVYYNRKMAELKLNDKVDTVYVPIEQSKYLFLTAFLERMVTTFFSTMPFYWQILLIMLMIGLLFVVYKLWSKK
jgi:hypothetical protein